MARARILKPGFFTNEVLAELPFEGRLLFAGLWTLADREGRLEDRPRRIKAELFPWDEVDVSAALIALETKGFISRYLAEGLPVIQIAKFAEHQTPHTREAASVLPPPPEPRKGRASAPPRSPVTVSVSDPVSDPVLALSFLHFPVVGPGASDWVLTEAQVSEWAGLFPGLDVRTEARKALAWVTASPGRRKTSRGMAKFLVGWLTRTTDNRSDVQPRRPDVGSVSHAWECPHTPHCGSQFGCRQRVELDAMKRPAKL